MLREYIEQLISSNQAEMEKLNEQLKRLIEDQKHIRIQIENLQREQSLDRNIFSPRRHVSSYYEKIEIAQEQLRETERKIERTQELIEAQLKKKEECDKLLEETERMTQEYVRGTESVMEAAVCTEESYAVANAAIAARTEESGAGSELTDGAIAARTEEYDAESELANATVTACTEESDAGLGLADGAIAACTEKSDAESELANATMTARTEESDAGSELTDRTMAARAEESDAESGLADRTMAACTDELLAKSELTDRAMAACTDEFHAKSELADTITAAGKGPSYMGQKLTESAGKTIQGNCENTDQAAETAASSETELIGKNVCEPGFVQNNIETDNKDNSLCAMEVTGGFSSDMKEQQPAVSDIAESIRTAADQQAQRMQENIAQEKLRVQTERLKELLTDLYRKNEVCMALLNGDKNRCKNEMRSMKKMIKKYAEEMF